ncbi:MAG: Ferri-bacillibactin esterase BesA [Anaerolineales bacterium]|nr:Ferri-bacillibactin esterase BesA [Anaerolineales bacterium]
MSPKPFNILASQTRLMKSKITKRTYRISISLPLASFKTSNRSWPFDNPLKKYPVVYLTDANCYFGMVTEMTRAMGWCGATTDAIIVGIGYPEDANPPEAWRDAVVGRTYGFTPAADEATNTETSKWLGRKVVTGGAPKFLQFIKQELIPAIEKDFPADPKKRVIAGHSHGGLFTAYALFNEPTLFNSFLICSPSLYMHDRLILKLEEQYAKRHKRLAAKVYLSVGELEEGSNDTMVGDLVRLAAMLQSRKHKGLTLRQQIFPDLNHCDVTAPGFQAGLKFALKKD